jgi:hypothetical protein
MSLLCKTVAKNIGTGGVGSTVSVTGVGFTPKACLAFYTSRSELVDARASNTSVRGMGFAGVTSGGIAQRAVGSYSPDNAAVGPDINELQVNRNDALIVETFAPLSVNGIAALTAFTADGCTLTIVDPFPVDRRVIFIFFGGDDLTNVAIGTIVGPQTGTVPLNQDITGLGFNPADGTSIGFLLQPSNEVDNDAAVDSDLGFGAFTRINEQGVLWSGANADQTVATQAASVCNDIQSWISPASSVASINRRAKFQQWISDGFRLQHAEISLVEVLGYYMILNGGRWDIRGFNTSTSLSDVVISGVGIGTPVGGLVFSHMKSETGDDAISADAGWSVGVFDSPTSRYAVAQYQSDNVAVSAVADAIEHDAVYININGSGTLQGLMDVKTIDSDGVTFTMDDADPVSSFGFVILAGSSGVDAPSGPLIEKIRIPELAEVGHDIWLFVFSTGHTAGTGFPLVTDMESPTGALFTRLGSSTDRKAQLYWKKATPTSAGLEVEVDGGVTALNLAILVTQNSPVGNPMTDFGVSSSGTNRSVGGFTPATTDSKVVIAIFSPNNSPISNISAPTLPLFTKRLESLLAAGSIMVADSDQNGGPSAFSSISWAQEVVPAGQLAMTFAIKPILGSGTGWTTETIVDALAAQESTERPLYGTNQGLTMFPDESSPVLFGHWLSKVFGSEDFEVTIDRAYVVASAEAPGQIGLSVTFDGGQTYSTEVVVDIPKSNFGLIPAFDWDGSTGSLWQLRIRPLAGFVTVHEVKVHEEPRGPAVH